MLIDVSKWNGNIDYAKVKTETDSVIIRAASGTGTDTMFYKNIDGALKQNMKVGVYVYSKAKTTSAAESEAKHVLDILYPYVDRLYYPIFFDSEEKGTEKNAKACAQAFINKINADGRFKAGVYASSSWWNSYLGGLTGSFTVWKAQWGSKQPSGADIWQYSDNGRVKGITGSVDLNKVISYQPAPLPPRPKEHFMIELEVLRNGDSGIQVRTIQRLLKELNYKGANGKDLVIDGDFGQNVETAVRSFQKAAGLKVDGVCGQATWSFLLKGQ